MAQQAKNPPAMQETQEMKVRSLGWGDSLQEGVEPHSSILGNPMDRGAWWVTVHGVTEGRTHLSN